LVITAPLKGIQSSTTVKLGLNTTQIKFPLNYITPEMMTEREGVVSILGPSQFVLCQDRGLSSLEKIFQAT
jgi:hypothetical protein